MSTRPTRRSLPDETVYPVEEKVGEDILQRWTMEVLRPLLDRYLLERGVKAFVGADQFIYFRRGDTRGRVAPDVYVLPGVPRDRHVRSWKTWEERIVPSFALEMVSTDVDKDYIDNPPLYAELGVKELIVFDPRFEDEPARFRFQVFRQVGRRGLVRVLVTNHDRVRSKVLRCWLRAIEGAAGARLRLAIGPDGDELVPTDAELVEDERAEKEHERAEKERERAARLALEAEIAALRREIGAGGKRKQGAAGGKRRARGPSPRG